MKSLVIKLLTVIFAVVFLLSGWKVHLLYSEYRTADTQYKELEQYISEPASPSPDQSQESGQTEAADTEPGALRPPQVNFDALRKINPNIVGWLVIEGTRINYPVVQGEDNDFYLTHQFDGQYNGAGCLFLDEKNDAVFSQCNQIIYGHYMKNRSMFHDLANYKEQEFFNEHPTGWLLTPTKAYQLQFFSGYVCDVYEDAWKIDFSEDDFAEWLKDRMAQSVFTSDVMPAADSHILTLSTCSYEYQNARFVLHAVLQEASCKEHLG